SRAASPSPARSGRPAYRLWQPPQCRPAWDPWIENGRPAALAVRSEKQTRSPRQRSEQRRSATRQCGATTDAVGVAAPETARARPLDDQRRDDPDQGDQTAAMVFY